MSELRVIIAYLCRLGAVALAVYCGWHVHPWLALACLWVAAEGFHSPLVITRAPTLTPVKDTELLR